MDSGQIWVKRQHSDGNVNVSLELERHSRVGATSGSILITFVVNIVHTAHLRSGIYGAL